VRDSSQFVNGRREEEEEEVTGIKQSVILAFGLSQ
jgi:hypothetical protein